MRRQRLETFSLAAHLIHVGLELLAALEASEEDPDPQVDVGSLGAKLEDALLDLQVFLEHEGVARRGRGPRRRA